MYPKTRQTKLDGFEPAHLIAICCGTPPSGRASFPLRLLADQLVSLKIVDSVSHETIRKTLKKTSLNQGFARNGVFLQKRMPPLFVLGKIFWRFTDFHIILCGQSYVWTNKVKQLIKEIRIPMATQPGQVSRFDSEYERNGTCNIFLSCEPLKGWRNLQVTDSRTKVFCAHYIRKLVNGKYANVEKIVLVSDNLNTHLANSFIEP